MRGIALSGYGMAEDVKKSIDAGFDEHLTKPVLAETLFSTIERVAAKPRPTLVNVNPGLDIK